MLVGLIGGGFASSVVPTIALADGLKSLFYCWVRKPVPGYAEAFIADDPDRYFQIGWEEISYTNFARARYVKPSGFITVSLRSKEVFMYGLFIIGAKLPPRQPGGPVLWFGFEADDLFLGGVAHYAYSIDKGRLEAYVGNGSVLRYDLTEFLPSDYSASRHYYSVTISRNLVMHHIDGFLRAVTVIVAGSEPISSVVYNGKPYKFGVTSLRPPPALRVLLDIDGGDISREWVWDDIHPWALRVMPGEPSTALHMPLYRDPGGEPLRDYISSGGDVVTAPIPGIGAKTIYLQAESPGRLEIQALVGVDRWRVYDAIETAGGELLSYTIEGDALAYRLKFEPRSNPARIVDASAIIS